MPLYQIKEFGKIVSGSESQVLSDGRLSLRAEDFDELWNHVLNLHLKNPAFEGAFKLSMKGGARILQAQNFVGLLETKGGVSVEILPKLYDAEGELSASACKAIMLRMVASFLDFKFISEQSALMDAKKNFPIFEIFIDAYVREAETILLKGLKRDYLKIDANRRFLKGGLVFSKDIVHNQFDRSKFYTQANEYEPDTAQHRIIKSTLSKLSGVSKVRKNRSRLRKLLTVFVDLNSSTDIPRDLAICERSGRLFADYAKIIEWSKVFLAEESFTAFAGANDNKSMLFPMEKLFESFVASLFKKYARGFLVHAQHSIHSLVEDHRSKSKFRLKPDLYMTSADETLAIVLDTKWKILDENQPAKNYLISQSDMYQAYAYGKKYSSDGRVTRLKLIYPYSASFKRPLDVFKYEKSESGSLSLSVIPFDLNCDYASQIEVMLGS